MPVKLSYNLFHIYFAYAVPTYVQPLPTSFQRLTLSSFASRAQCPIVSIAAQCTQLRPLRGAVSSSTIPRNNRSLARCLVHYYDVTPIVVLKFVVFSTSATGCSLVRRVHRCFSVFHIPRMYLSCPQPLASPPACTPSAPSPPPSTPPYGSTLASTACFSALCSKSAPSTPFPTAVLSTSMS